MAGRCMRITPEGKAARYQQALHSSALSDIILESETTSGKAGTEVAVVLKIGGAA